MWRAFSSFAYRFVIRLVKVSHERAHCDEDTSRQERCTLVQSLKHQKFFDVKKEKNFYVVNAFQNKTLVLKKTAPDIVVVSIIGKIIWSNRHGHPLY